MNIVVRPVRPGDEAAVAALLSQLGYPTTPAQARARLAAAEARGGLSSLVAEQAGDTVGFAGIELARSYTDDHPIGRVVVMVVDVQRRGEGIGAALLQQCERRLIEAGAAKIVITSAVHRDAAHRFYERHGYSRTGLRFGKSVPSRRPNA